MAYAGGAEDRRAWPQGAGRGTTSAAHNLLAHRRVLLQANGAFAIPEQLLVVVSPGALIIAVALPGHREPNGHASIIHTADDFLLLRATLNLNGLDHPLPPAPR